MLSEMDQCAGPGIVPPPHLEVCDSLDVLAPRMAEAWMATVVDCKAQGLAVPVVFETRRSKELQAHYYTRGRPPSHEYPEPVTGQRDAMLAWHFYGVALDFIHPTLQWSAPLAWFARVAAIAESHGLKSGLHYPKPDAPHLYWGGCGQKPVHAPDIYTRTPGTDADKLLAVWKACGATFPA